MDENELRIAALELLWIERLALEPRDVILKMNESIRQGLPEPGKPVSQDEVTIRKQALVILQDGAHRNELFGLSWFLPKG